MVSIYRELVHKMLKFMLTPLSGKYFIMGRKTSNEIFITGTYRTSSFKENVSCQTYEISVTHSPTFSSGKKLH